MPALPTARRSNPSNDRNLVHQKELQQETAQMEKEAASALSKQSQNQLPDAASKPKAKENVPVGQDGQDASDMGVDTNDEETSGKEMSSDKKPRTKIHQNKVTKMISPRTKIQLNKVTWMEQKWMLIPILQTRLQMTRVPNPVQLWMLKRLSMTQMKRTKNQTLQNLLTRNSIQVKKSNNKLVE